MTGAEPVDPSEIVELRQFGDGPAQILIEVPHGATERSHYDRLAQRLESDLPANLHEFFHVNTDFGAPELAQRVAEMLAGPARDRRGRSVVVARALVPRTFVDLNREVASEARPGMTPGLPPYIRSGRDRELLTALHRRYCERISAEYAAILGSGGLAIALHTYAPRSVEVDVDADIVGALRKAYRPAAFRRWRLRPPIDFITADAAGTDLSPRPLVDDLRARYAALGLESGENSTYHLHPATLGYRFAARYPGRVLCVEFRRDLLGSPWRPFAPSRVGMRKISRLARPLAEALERSPLAFG